MTSEPPVRSQQDDDSRPEGNSHRPNARIVRPPLSEPLEFAPDHFWTYRETPYETSIRCQCGWGWRWGQPWGGRDVAWATYRDHARNETGWTPTERGEATWQGSST